MEELIDMIVSDESPSQISDKIKELLYARAGEKVDEIRPEVANNLFGNEYEEEE